MGIMILWCRALFNNVIVVIVKNCYMWVVECFGLLYIYYIYIIENVYFRGIEVVILWNIDGIVVIDYVNCW